MSARRETALLHKQVLAEKFSTDVRYWTAIYEKRLPRENAFHGHEMRTRKDTVLRLVDAYAGQRKLSILDAGCGAGLTMRDLLHRGHSVVGTDLADAMLDQANTRPARSVPVRGACVSSDVENLPFADRSFDAVVCMGVLQYLETDEKALDEISRVVRDGGLVILTLPNLFKASNFLDPYYYIVRWVQFVRWRWFRPQDDPRALASPDDFNTNAAFANRRYCYGQLSGLFRRNRLSETQTVPVAFGPPTLWRKPLLGAGLAIRFSDFLRRSALGRGFSFLVPFANRWVIALKKDRSMTRRYIESGSTPAIGGRDASYQVYTRRGSNKPDQPSDRPGDHQGSGPDGSAHHPGPL